MADPEVEDVTVPNADDVEVCNKITRSSSPTTMDDRVLELAVDLGSQSGVNLAVGVETQSVFENGFTAGMY